MIKASAAKRKDPVAEVRIASEGVRRPRLSRDSHCSRKREVKRWEMGETFSFISFISGWPVSFTAVTIYLSVCAAQDMKQRRISLRWSVCMGTLALMVDLAKAVAFMDEAGNVLPRELLSGFLLRLTCLAPGCLLLILSAAAKGSAGAGDGICFLIVGALTDSRTVWILLAASLFLASVFGIVLICMRKADRKTRLPFLVFAEAAWAIVLLSRLCRVK